jgi:hypothetical protein
MHVLPCAPGFQPVLENSDGSIELGDSVVLAWMIDDDGSVVPLTVDGPQDEAVGVQTPSGKWEIAGLGVFPNAGEARVAWADRAEES